MPCQSDYLADPEPSVLKSTYDTLLKAHNQLVKESDMLREFALAVANGEEPELPLSVKKELEKRQIAHRKVDLKRLENTFIKNKDTARLEKVWKASPNRALEPQLGFDPDDF